jgi:hypothetical protein
MYSYVVAGRRAVRDNDRGAATEALDALYQSMRARLNAYEKALTEAGLDRPYDLPDDH